MTEGTAVAQPSLGICVTTRASARHVLGLASAAARAGVSTEVFLTGEGVHLIRDHRFDELVEAARVSVCDASYRSAGLEGTDVNGLTDKDFVTQWRNAEMVERCDRYLVL
jgi:peroxiredoxin family protein